MEYFIEILMNFIKDIFASDEDIIIYPVDEIIYEEND